MPAITARPTLILLHGFRGAPQGLAAIADDLVNKVNERINR